LEIAEFHECQVRRYYTQQHEKSIQRIPSILEEN